MGQLLFLSRLDGRHQLWVYTGPAFDRHKPLGTIGDGVAIPTHFWKIIVDERAEGRISTIGFMLRNGESAPFYECMATGDSIELATGIDFLPSLEDVAEEEAESHFILSDWQGTDTSSAKPAVASPPARTPTRPGDGPEPRPVPPTGRLCHDLLDQDRKEISPQRVPVSEREQVPNYRGRSQEIGAHALFDVEAASPLKSFNLVLRRNPASNDRKPIL